MLDMIYAFGIGLSFAIGIAFGAFLARMASAEGRKEWAEEQRRQHEVLVELLGKKNDILHYMMMSLQALERK